MNTTVSEMFQFLSKFKDSNCRRRLQQIIGIIRTPIRSLVMPFFVISYIITINSVGFLWYDSSTGRESLHQFVLLSFCPASIRILSMQKSLLFCLQLRVVLCFRIRNDAINVTSWQEFDTLMCFIWRIMLLLWALYAYTKLHHKVLITSPNEIYHFC